MAKKKKKSKQQQQQLEPKSPPPAAAPPAPPSHTAIAQTASEFQSLLGHYQQDYGGGQQQPQLRDELQSYGGTPTITNYNNNPTFATGYGDIHLRPNTGQDNWMDSEILGLALSEILKLLQWSTILACAGLIVLEILVAIFRLFSPARFIFGCYLAFFASLLLRVEIAQILRQHKTLQALTKAATNNDNTTETEPFISGIGSHSKLPNVGAPRLRDNFGLLFHPSGKATLLLFMASMCVGQFNNLIEVAVGLVLGLNAMVIFYLLCRYPGYRRSEDIPIPKLPALFSTSGSGNQPPQSNTWSYYENDASAVWKVTSGIAEGAAVLTGTNGNE